jgi:large subunit ribosomal protein L24
VMLLVEVEGKKVGSRIGYRVETVDRDGRPKSVRVRYAKRTGEDI